MKRTLVTALLLPFFLLTVGSLGCKAAALPLSAPVAAAMAEEGLTVNPSTIQHFSVRKNGTTHRRCGAAHLRDVPPLTKGRCFIQSRMKQRGNTPRKCGVYGHCRDSTSEVSAECAECIDVPPTRTVAAATVAQHDEIVMFLRQPSAATSLSEGGLWCNIYLSGVRHRYDAVISRHNVVVVRHTEGVALSPLHKGRCPTGQRGKHHDFVLLCYATSMTCRATFPVGKVQYVESTEFSCRKSAGWRRVLPQKCRKF